VFDAFQVMEVPQEPSVAAVRNAVRHVQDFAEGHVRFDAAQHGIERLRPSVAAACTAESASFASPEPDAHAPRGISRFQGLAHRIVNAEEIDRSLLFDAVAIRADHDTSCRPRRPLHRFISGTVDVPAGRIPPSTAFAAPPTIDVGDEIHSPFRSHHQLLDKGAIASDATTDVAPTTSSGSAGRRARRAASADAARSLRDRMESLSAAENSSERLHGDAHRVVFRLIRGHRSRRLRMKPEHEASAILRREALRR
jgi:hypothetical protein